MNLSLVVLDSQTQGKRLCLFASFWFHIKDKVTLQSPMLQGKKDRPNINKDKGGHTIICLQNRQKLFSPLNVYRILVKQPHLTFFPLQPANDCFLNNYLLKTLIDFVSSLQATNPMLSTFSVKKLFFLRSAEMLKFCLLVLKSLLMETAIPLVTLPQPITIYNSCQFILFEEE